MKKKTIVITVFSVLIFITLILFASLLRQALSYDVAYPNGVYDLGAGVLVLVLVIVGGNVVLYEFDLFYTICYFLIKTKTKIRSILNILSNLTLVIVLARVLALSIFADGLALFDEVVASPLDLFFIYVVLRIIYFIVSIFLRFNRKG